MTDREPANETKTVALVLETELDAPVDRVWRALTDASIVSQWLMAATPVADGAMRLADPVLGDGIVADVIESNAPSRLVWRWLHDADGEVLDSTVRFELTPIGERRTHLRLVHDGFTVPAEQSVDRIVTVEDDSFVLLPLASLVARRRIRRPRPQARRHGALPTIMQLVA